MGCRVSRHEYCCVKTRLIKALKHSSSEENVPAEVVLEALTQTSKEARTRRLISILSPFVEDRRNISGFNIFHTLYICVPKIISKYHLFPDRSHDINYPEITSALLKNGHDVNDTSGRRTYPLYSLLSSNRLILMCLENGYFEACLRLLLSAGANPNLDETVAHKGEANNHSEREAYPSALSCLLDCIAFDYAYYVYKEYNLSKINETLINCLQLLINYGAEAGEVITIPSSPFNGCVSNSTVLEKYLLACTPVLGVDQRILALLLKNGADPMAASNEFGEHVISMYCSAQFQYIMRMKCWERLGGAEESDLDQQFDRLTLDAAKLMIVCKYMPLDSLMICKKDIERMYQRRNSDGYIWPRWGNSDVEEEIDKCLCTIRSLQHECSTVILRCCSYSQSDVQSLPLPSELKQLIVPQYHINT